MHWITHSFLVVCLGVLGISGQGPAPYFGIPRGPGYNQGVYRPVYTERTYYAAPAPSAQAYWRPAEPAYVDSYPAPSYDRYPRQPAYVDYHGDSGYPGQPSYQGYQETYEAPAVYPAPAAANHIEEYQSYQDNKDDYHSNKDSEDYHSNNKKEESPQHAKQYQQRELPAKIKKDPKPVYKETMHSLGNLPPRQAPRPARRRGPGSQRKAIAAKRIYRRREEKKEEEEEEGGSGEIDDCSMMKVT